MKLTYGKFLQYGIDIAPLGLEQRTEEPAGFCTPQEAKLIDKYGLAKPPPCMERKSADRAYFCTPKGAEIIGWAGVDGIHYCLIQGFGEMVFAVSPMNPAPHYVHPLARNFADFLRLLLACGDSAALEQAWQWDLAQFQAFVAENPPTEGQKTVLTQIARQTGLSPIEAPWQYLHELQASFDYSKIQYAEESYDADIAPDVSPEPPAWKVTFENGFHGDLACGRAGKEVVIRKEFDWAGHHWIIPSVYLCGKGLVVDFCMQVDPVAIRLFAAQQEAQMEQQQSREQRMQLRLDDPLRLDFRSIVQLNGKRLENPHGFGMFYDPTLLPECAIEDEAKWVVEYYGLDKTCGWGIQRFSYLWATKRKPEIRSLSLTMIQEKVSVPGPRFQIHAPGDEVPFSYGDQEHILTVQALEPHTMDWSRLPDTGLEHPTHYMAICYTVTPELPDGTLTIVDCDKGDRPRQAFGQSPASMVMGCIGIGLRANISGHDHPEKFHTAHSSLHFEPVEQVEWQMVFHEKPFADIMVDLLP